MSRKISEQELIDDYQRVANQLEKIPTLDEYKAHGEYSHRPIYRLYDNMAGLKQAAGFDAEPFRTGKVETECEVCGTVEEIRPSKAEQRRFCSQDCMFEWRSESISGENNPQYKEPVQLRCERCNEAYRVAPYKENTSRFCSQDCMIEWRARTLSGENHPRWNGGKPSYHGKNWRRQRRRARKRDNYTCRRCGLTDEESLTHFDSVLQVHHRVPIARFDQPESANFIENLVTLCLPCHQTVEASAEYI